MSEDATEPRVERWGWQAGLGAVLSLLGAPVSLFAGLAASTAGAQVRSWPSLVIGSLMCLAGFAVFLSALVRLRTLSPLLYRRALIGFIAGMGVEGVVTLLLFL